MSNEEKANEMIVKDQQHTGGELVQALNIDQIVGQVRLVQEVMQAVMKKGEHYGTIPGCGDKPTLLKPGAEKLALAFGLSPKYEITKTHDGEHVTFGLVCNIYSRAGVFLGSGVGEGTTKESKHRYRNAQRKCPECGEETILKSKKDGGWFCWKKKGGCGRRWPDGAKEIENQPRGKVENVDPADQYNTVLKMSKKRAFVDAVLTVTAASDIFTQDLEDLPDAIKPEPETKAKSAPKKPEQKTQPKNHNQAPPPETKPETSKSGDSGVLFENFEDCLTVCDDELKGLIRETWKTRIHNQATAVQIFNDNFGDVEAIKAYLRQR